METAKTEAIANTIRQSAWAMVFCVNALLACAFWLCWTVFGIGAIYFNFLPPVWQSIPFWNCVGLFFSVSIIKSVFVPKLASVEQSVGK